MGNLAQVASGWYNYVRAEPSLRWLMLRRLVVCDGCEHKVQLNPAGMRIMEALNMPENTFKCGLCSCPLGTLASTRLPGCKAGKWNKIK